MPDIFTEDQQNKTETETPTTAAAEIAKDYPINLFTTYCKYPRGISFAEQEDNEDIILFLRRDFITNVPWFLSTIGLAFVPFLIRFIFVSTGFSLFSLPN